MPETVPKIVKHTYLLPGKYRVTRLPETIETLVGSCVAVCIYNTKTGQSAMNHYLRARPTGKNDLNIGEFGSISIDYIIKKLFESDPDPTHYRAQIFGGAAVLEAKSDKYNIGHNNIEIAIETLAAYRIRVIKKEVGGPKGRRIIFDTSTNTVTCRLAGQVGKKYNQPEK